MAKKTVGTPPVGKKGGADKPKGGGKKGGKC